MHSTTAPTVIPCSIRDSDKKTNKTMCHFDRREKSRGRCVSHGTSRFARGDNLIFVFVFFWIPAGAGITYLVLTFFSSFVLAVGISVSPPELTLRGAPNQTITGSFTVTNPSRETVIYEVANDGLVPLVITPTTFLLEPNKSADVTIEYQPNDNPLLNKEARSPGVRRSSWRFPLETSQTTLSILGRPLTVNPTSAASGVKLPVSISIGAAAGASISRYDPVSIGLIIIDILLLIWLVYLIVRKSRTSRSLSSRTCLPRSEA